MPERMNDDGVKMVAALAGIDPRTVRRIVIDGKPARSGATTAAVVKALRKMGRHVVAREVEREAGAG